VTGCTVASCDRKPYARGLCKTHYMRQLRSSPNPSAPIRVQHADGSSHANWSGALVGYRGAHNRVLSARGSASEHQCAHSCGRQAHHWAYDHSDPSPLTSDQGPYSTDIDRYIPLCGSCHKTMDLAHARPGLSHKLPGHPIA
jgi:hypothetical protein